MRSSPLSCYFVSLMPKCLSHPFLKYPQPIQCDTSSFTPVLNIWQNQSSVYLNINILGYEQEQKMFRTGQQQVSRFSLLLLFHEYNICHRCSQVFEICHNLRGCYVFYVAILHYYQEMHAYTQLFRSVLLTNILTSD